MLQYFASGISSGQSFVLSVFFVDLCGPEMHVWICIPFDIIYLSVLSILLDCIELGVTYSFPSLLVYGW